jgi:hypothetical protein
MVKIFLREAFERIAKAGASRLAARHSGDAMRGLRSDFTQKRAHG